MRRLNERKIVVVLFVMVIITFAFAQNDTTKMEKAYQGITKKASPAIQPIARQATSAATVYSR